VELKPNETIWNFFDVLHLLLKADPKNSIKKE
jgi:hypothetical protein